MKNVIIVHGWGGNPDEPVLVWLDAELAQRGYRVIRPAMPHPDEPTIDDWTGKLKEAVGDLKGEIIFVGHSIGCQTILRYLENPGQDIHTEKVVLIAPWMKLDEETIREEGEESIEIAKPWVETPIDFVKVKERVGKCVALFSDDDPFVPLSQKDLFAKELDAEVIVEHAKGHFSQGDGITELPSALAAVTA